MTQPTVTTTPSPFYSLIRAAWVPCPFAWDAVTGEWHRREGTRGFPTYREALEASRFLALDTGVIHR